MEYIKQIRFVDWLSAGSVFVVLFAIMQGFTAGSPKVAVVFGFLSCLFWLSASALPIYWSKLKNSTDILNGLNAFAAACTGAAVLASIPNAWNVVFE